MPNRCLGREGRSTTTARGALRLAWTDCLKTLPAAGDRRKDVLSPERLFDALDGRSITIQGRRWQIEVFSACVEADATWLQLSLEGESSYTLLLRLAPNQGPKHAVHILSSWLANPVDDVHILNVA